MKIYAVVKTPEELKDRLIRWYQKQAENKMHIAETSPRASDRDRYYAQSATYLHIAAELLELEIVPTAMQGAQVGVMMI